MKKMKKKANLFFVICLIVMFTLVGCSQDANVEPEKAAENNAGKEEAKTIKYPTKPITIIVPFAAGGGGDLGARFISAEAEKILGQPISIVNKPGASGWLGWTDMLLAPRDGYTLGSYSDYNIVSGYLDPQQKRDNSLDDFAPIVCYAKDHTAYSIRPDETRFTTIEELVEYAKVNEVSITCSGTTNLVGVTKMNETFDTKFLPVFTSGGSESLTAVMGGHVDVLSASVGECKIPNESNQIKTIVVMKEERSEYIPDAPTIKEAFDVDMVNYSARGIGAASGIDPAIMDILIDAFAKAAETDNFKAQMEQQGLNRVVITGDDYMKQLRDLEVELKTMAPALGW